MAEDELAEMARRVIDGNRYLVLGTVEADGLPRLSPVYFTPARYRDFYWVSSPDAQHSRNVRERPEVRIVVFDSSTSPGTSEAVYMSATARELAEHELPEVLDEAFDQSRGGRRFAPEELSGDGDLRLYVATATAYDVHVRGSHPTYGTGIDRRMATDPTTLPPTERSGNGG
ncbi:MAG TPA: pyridoxamine 5'-phosphate oxidase family protein [Nocardioides sp.]|uniref:pyridoxamine 5'-phosphate oxidase family protein n=1 Tax=Nocardioides sp. TaxID=35761 RepID=UPI002F410304